MSAHGCPGRSRRKELKCGANSNVDSGIAFQHAGDGMSEEIVILAIFIDKGIVAILVDEAHMHMHAIARARAIGLGHEGGGKAVLAGNALDDALGKDNVIGSLQADPCHAAG